MIKFNLSNGKTINVATQLSEIKLKQFENCIDYFNRKYDFDIDLYINLISELSDASYDEVEELDLTEFVSIIPQLEIQDIDSVSKTFVNKIEIDNVIYMSTATENEYKFNVKQIRHIQDIIKKQGNAYLVDLAAMIFRAVQVDGQLEGLDDKSVERRKKVFADKKVNLADLPVVMQIAQKSNVLVDAVAGIKEIPVELKDLSQEELVQIAAAHFALIKAVKEA